MVRYGMYIDMNRCIGCFGCALACKQENFTPPGMWWSRVHVTETGEFPNTTIVNTPLQCNHCDNPPCVTVCPTGASYKRADGIVVLDQDKCIGCKYCIQACPYGVRSYLSKIAPYNPQYGFDPYEKYGYDKHQEGVVEKCIFCTHRIDEAANNGLKPGVDRAATPACVITCVAYARVFGDLDDPNSEVSKMIAKNGARPLKPEFGTKPKIYYAGLPQEA